MALKAEAREWLEWHPADRWRLGLDAWGCDDPEKFFRRASRDVSDADIIRWRACCAAARELEG